MKYIYIAQYYTENLSHGPFSEKINEKYANENGYGYYCEKNNEKILKYIKGSAPTWYKPNLILEIFEKYSPEYVLFLDTDAIIDNTNIKIDEFIDDDYCFIAASDDSTHSIMNAGVFLIKNCEWSIEFLKDWEYCRENLSPIECSVKPETSVHDEKVKGFYSNRLWMDQTALTYLYNDKKNHKKNIKIISNRSFNWRRYGENNFIFHAYDYSQVKNRTIDKIYNEKFNLSQTYDNTKLNSLAEKYYTDKHFDHDYFDKIYQKEFEPGRLKYKKVVELGVHEGQSINVWREFFINAEIIGIDCQIDRAKIDDYNRVKLLQFTIGHNKEKELIKFCFENQDIDLFIDDGSHIMKDQQIVFGKVFKSLKSNGIYVLEDLHTSISVQNDENSIWKSEKNTRTLDMLENYQKTGKIVSDYLSSEEINYLNKNIKSVDIYKNKPNWSITSIIRKK